MYDFAVAELVAKLMAGYERPWGICGGWAIDLYLGQVTREHRDIEIAIFRKDQTALQAHLRDWHLTKVVSLTGQRDQWNEGEQLLPPIHEIHAQQKDGGVCDLEILLNETFGDYWQFRRDTRITRPLSNVWGYSGNSIPYMNPEIVLLYKAKKPTANDEADFVRVSAVLHAEPRSWLKNALAVCYPGHRWCDSL
jgi:hypothetical protein